MLALFALMWLCGLFGFMAMDLYSNREKSIVRQMPLAVKRIRFRTGEALLWAFTVVASVFAFYWLLVVLAWWT